MAAGQWAETPSQANYVGAGNWGNGIDPVHASTNGGLGRNLAPGTPGEGVDSELVGGHYDGDGYVSNVATADDCDEIGDGFWGYGIQTGTADRPSLGDNTGDGTRASVQKGWPSWGHRKHGLPGGMVIRSENNGADLTNQTKLQNLGISAAYGWENKETGVVEDSVTSDPSQYEMQTSMTQRDKTREGSQISGTASEYSAPVKSRIPGQKLKIFGGGGRHYDMEPKGQDQVVRPFWTRRAGTGDSTQMQPNSMYLSTPYSRVSPANPFPGDPVGSSVIADGNSYQTDTLGYGFQDEDVVY